MMKKEKNLLESIIMVIIFLVLIQTFLDDLANILDWTWQIRKILVITGFAFDVLFTLEFFIRFFSAVTRGKGELRKYFFLNRGWIDLAASLPLLLLNSGPSFFALFTGMVIGGFSGMLNILKVVKAVRIARILRLLRVLKIFKQIKFADSLMVQRHSAKIVTTAVSSIILPITLLSFFVSFVHMEDVENYFTDSHLESARYIAASPELYENPEKMDMFCSGQTSFLIIRHNGNLLYSRMDQESYDRQFGKSDYAFFEEGDFEFFVDLKPLSRTQSWSNLVIFITVLFVVAMIMLFYSPYFAINVSDPVNIMRKGMSEKGYHLQVAIPEDLKDGDLFVLAKHYNEEFLPLKMRNQQEDEGAGLELEVDDLEDLFNF